jgi:UDP-N-acetylmuramyl pentapeptide phosphotransferase/UDP-N-acetylglucosamine-1-phosphate transferase
VPLAGALVLAAVSWLDDLRGGLPPLPRFAVQVAAVGVGVVALPGEGLIFQGLLPVAIDHALAAIAWLWFVNLFNFMDGIDGISGTEATSIGLGVFALAMLGTVLPGFGPLGLALAGVSLGFLIWNWNPAKIFLGDVGSVPLGFLAGWLLLALAAAGAWQAALLLPGYYLADATVTLIRRLSRGEKVWQAHREHFYQKVVIAGWSHARTSGAIGLANLALIGLALGSQLSVVVGWVTLAAGTILVMAFLWYLARRGSDIGSCGVSE